MIHSFSEKTFKRICNQLAKKDVHLAEVLKTYGHPPMWTRTNSFESLVHIILEQQVSLASALAALKKLQAHTGQLIPEAVLKLTDAELRACYVSRQKAVYIRGLAEAIISGKIDLDGMHRLPDVVIREKLTTLKGIGNWTVDVYLMFVLQRADIFPAGDLAAVNALKRLKTLPKDTSKEELIAVAEKWAPHRTVATMILWHHYLSAGRKKQPEAGSNQP
ncbi:DNA-3-methyladenine glycosylase family protein [Niabella beijingensis]|uniref:DNA-3-methyladenine glycosylase family protein n=1 Tax=Niabella beijingensis TaxID=2872700 RepID=UPI001CBBBEE7|nr:DNA-3-methyladenine glycosylase 2 family protein [Niabella beijingensis]MBZ4187530.1 DNA-3-methyladenine glycosylase 2 family protein [Niabella beijingensis]